MAIDRSQVELIGSTHRQLLGRRAVLLVTGGVVLSMVCSVLLAPGVDPTGWDWARLVLGVLIGGEVLVLLAASQRAPAGVNTHQVLLAALALVITGFILNLTFSLGTTLVYSLMLTVAGVLTLSHKRAISKRTVGLVLAALMPFWVWNALDAWSAGLLLLIPLAAVAVIVDGHMRLATQVDDPARGLTRRGHRLAAWLGVLGAALMVVLLRVATGDGFGAILLIGVGSILLVGLSAGTPSNNERAWWISSVTIIDVACAWIAVCWIVGLS